MIMKSSNYSNTVKSDFDFSTCFYIHDFVFPYIDLCK